MPRWGIHGIWDRLQNRKNHIYGSWQPEPSTNLGLILALTRRIDIVNQGPNDPNEIIYFDFYPISPEHRHIFDIDGLYPIRALFAIAIYENYKLVGDIRKDEDLDFCKEP